MSTTNQVTTIAAPVADFESPAVMKVIRNAFCKDLNDAEFDAFQLICKNTRLSPLKRQISAQVYSKDDKEKRKMVIVTEIGGLRSIAERSGRYRPDEEDAVITYDNDLKSPLNPLGIVSAKVYVWKQDSLGEWHKAAGTAYWDEFVPKKEIWEPDPETGKRRPSGKYQLDPFSNWYKMPRLMIVKCAEAQALRRAFPEDLSGLYEGAEMDKAIAAEDKTPSEMLADLEKQERQAITGTKDSIPFAFGYGAPIEYVPTGKAADRLIEFIRKIDNTAELQQFRDTNKQSFNKLWADQKSDGLEVKKALEQREKILQNLASAEENKAQSNLIIGE